MSKKLNGSPLSRLKEIYTDLKNPASFSSANKLAHAAGVTKKVAESFLRSVDAHTLHRERRKNFKRNRYVIPRMNYLYEADLIDMSNIKAANKGYTFVLNCIDCFSKYLWSIPLKNKKAETVLQAFKIIFKNKSVKFLQSDLGNEFKNKHLQNYLKLIKTKLIFPRTSAKCSIVERVNKTIKNKMFKYFTHKGTQNYIDVLPAIVKGYNNTVHSSTGHKPAEVNKKNEKDVLPFLYGRKSRYSPLKASAQPRKSILVNSFVRISRDSGVFAKGYEGYWSNEVFKVKKIINKPQTLYVLEDLQKKTIDGRFNFFELQLVDISDKTQFRINKIIKAVGKGRSRRLFVSWVGYPDSFNSYIYEKDLTKL
jgi:hypothetical protein